MQDDCHRVSETGPLASLWLTSAIAVPIWSGTQTAEQKLKADTNTRIKSL